MGALGKTFRSVASQPLMWRARRLRGRRVLVVGIYLRNKTNLAPEIMAQLHSDKHRVAQRWASVGVGEERAAEMAAATVLSFAKPTPKFTIVNRILARENLAEYDYVLITDDDIELPDGFLDDFIGVQETLCFALAQPARTLESNVDHPVTQERHSCIARETAFVEIGPLFCVATPAFGVLMPFDESFYMGWGLDQVWPLQMKDAGLRMGVIDITPVHHRMRPVASTYSSDAARQQMVADLQGRQIVADEARVGALRFHRW